MINDSLSSHIENDNGEHRISENKNRINIKSTSRINQTIHNLNLILVFLISGIFVFSSHANAQTHKFRNEKWIVISDIDDTIKNSYSRARMNYGYLGYLISAQAIFQNPMPMNGMPELYQYFISDLGFKIFYVTDFPYANHNDLTSEFLKNSRFPEGAVYHRDPNNTRNDFKLEVISKIINQEKPQGVILIGDNADYDAVSYFWVSDLFQKIKTLTFIKQSNTTKYNSSFPNNQVLSLFPQQKGYVTSVDLAGELALLGMVDSNFLYDLNSLFLNNYHHEYFYFAEPDLNFRPISFPPWMNCQDYKPNPEIAANYAFTSKVFELIKTKCTPTKPQKKDKFIFQK
jgi:hypothetical protein